ncbi:MAG TPA: tRNA (adenosine(37)-N6)-threonylcarbamoyltransferase complex dimerization subunit type 1 TsaB [Actinomycetota bacterium]|nr:tRNA (adenosine(37)-N6)-threonylcarbamoyltransferase complex dimerization subunit type 1 TsaB [Actinomycetota bacterium]
MLVLAIDTSTMQTSVALGTEQGTVGAVHARADRPHHEMVSAAIAQLLEWSGTSPDALGGVAVGLGPGLFTGMRVGIATGKTMAQTIGIPIVGVASIDLLAFSARYARRLICAATDAKRGEVFYAFYRPVPGGVAREEDFQVGTPDDLLAELEARREDILLVGSGGLVYRQRLEGSAHVELASPGLAHPSAEALVELAVPRFVREEFDRLYDVQPIYIRKADAEIAWDQRRGAG